MITGGVNDFAREHVGAELQLARDVWHRVLERVSYSSRTPP